MVMKQLGVVHSYTLEASICGTLIGSNSDQVQTHFNIHDLKEMGQVFCQTLGEFLDSSPMRVSRLSAGEWGGSIQVASICRMSEKDDINKTKKWTCDV